MLISKPVGHGFEEQTGHQGRTFGLVQTAFGLRLCTCSLNYVMYLHFRQMMRSNYICIVISTA